MKTNINIVDELPKKSKRKIDVDKVVKLSGELRKILIKEGKIREDDENYYPSRDNYCY